MMFFQYGTTNQTRYGSPTTRPPIDTDAKRLTMADEVRDLEDDNPIEGGDDHHIQLNMQSLPGGVPTASQQAALVRIGGGNNANQTR